MNTHFSIGKGNILRIATYMIENHANLIYNFPATQRGRTADLDALKKLHRFEHEV